MKCYMCSKCNKISTSTKAMLSHLEKHEDGDVHAIVILCEEIKEEIEPALEYPCDHCDETFADEDSYFEHQQVHYDDQTIPHIIIEESDLPLESDFPDKPFQCPECMVSFAHSISLKRHIMKHTGEKPYACTMCERKFIKNNDLKRHIMTHTGEKPFECYICHHRFAAKGNLKTHLRRHNNEKPFACEYCGRRFAAKGTLICHKRIHTGEKPFECELCNRKFTQKCQLIQHNNVHHENQKGEFPYGCEVCSRTFRNKAYLARHLRVHTDGKVHKCFQCDKSYYHKSNLITHLEMHKKEEKRKTKEPFRTKLRETGRGRIYECPHCNKEFRHKHGLIHHIRIHTGEKPYECQVCNKRFTQKSHLQIHNIVHTNDRPFKCEFCEKTFRHKRSLNSHVRVHSTENIPEEKESECTVADDSNKQEMTEESTETSSYACSICEKQFCYQRSLLVHYKAHQEVMFLLSEEDVKNEEEYYNNDLEVAELVNVKTEEVDSDADDLKPSLVIEENIDLSSDEDRDENNYYTLINEHLNSDDIPDGDISEKDLDALEDESSNHLSEILYDCPLCGETFSDKISLKFHLKIHTTEKIHECPVCSKKFSLKAKMEMHIKSHDVDKPYLCQNCEIPFRTKDELIDHICDQTDESDFEQPNSFPFDKDLDDVKIEIGPITHNCKKCSLEFLDESTLQQHLLNHTGVKPFKCNICNKSFTYRNTLLWHVKEFHHKQTVYECNICEKQFKRKYHYQIHLQNHEKNV